MDYPTHKEYCHHLQLLLYIFALQSFPCLPYLDTQKPEKVTEELINLLSPNVL